MKKGTLDIEYKNKVAYITFGHPGSNSLPSFLLKNITKTLNKLSRTFIYQNLSKSPCIFYKLCESYQCN